MKYDEVEPQKSKREKITKILGPDFLTYLLENEPQTNSKIMSYLEVSY
jgi:hypothetical protein